MRVVESDAFTAELNAGPPRPIRVSIKLSRTATARRRRLVVLLVAVVVGGWFLMVVVDPASRAPTAGPAVVAGTVVLPVAVAPTRAGQPESAQPVVGARVSMNRDGIVVATGRTDEHGRFRLVGAPGPVVLQAQTMSGGYVARASLSVTLIADSTVTVRIALDNGVR